jgi:CheY-like chemotaxis protein
MKPLLFVVDDDIDDIELVQDVLNQIPDAPELKYFLSAEDFLKYFKGKILSSFPPFAITLDINLPGMNGVELLSVLRKQYDMNQIPISVMTTSSSIEQKNQCMENGAFHFFTKPVKMNDWLKIIQSVIHDINY